MNTVMSSDRPNRGIVALVTIDRVALGMWAGTMSRTLYGLGNHADSQFSQDVSNSSFAAMFRKEFSPGQ
jgi:predicted alpha/beta hydrolase